MLKYYPIPAQSLAHSYIEETEPTMERPQYKTIPFFILENWALFKIKINDLKKEIFLYPYYAVKTKQIYLNIRLIFLSPAQCVLNILLSILL